MRIKINAATVTIAGKPVRVSIVRDSKWCKWLTDKDFLVLGNSVHYRAERLQGYMIRRGIEEVRRLHEEGFLKFYWKLLTSNEN